MIKSTIGLNRYLSKSYKKLKSEVSKYYYLDMDIFHDSIIDIYELWKKGQISTCTDVEKEIVSCYQKNRNIRISHSYKVITKEDGVLDYLNNEIGSNAILSSSTRTLKDKLRLMLNKEEYRLIDLYFFQKHSKRKICVFTQKSMRELENRLEKIKTKIYENYIP